MSTECPKQIWQASVSMNAIWRLGLDRLAAETETGEVTAAQVEEMLERLFVRSGVRQPAWEISEYLVREHRWNAERAALVASLGGVGDVLQCSALPDWSGPEEILGRPGLEVPALEEDSGFKLDLFSRKKPRPRRGGSQLRLIDTDD